MGYLILLWHDRVVWDDGRHVVCRCLLAYECDNACATGYCSWKPRSEDVELMVLKRKNLYIQIDKTCDVSKQKDIVHQ